MSQGKTNDKCVGTQMRRLVFSLVFAVFLISGAVQPSAAQSFDEITNIVTRAVIERCRGGTIEGSSSDLEIEGGADGAVVFLKRFFELGLDGRVKFSKKEWDGIEPFLIESDNVSNYYACVEAVQEPLQRKLEEINRDRIGKVKLYEGSIANVCSPQISVSVDVFAGSHGQTKQEAHLTIEGVSSNPVRLRTGEVFVTPGLCSIGLAGTRSDVRPYAWISYVQE